MMVQLHFICPKDHVCPQLCKQRTSLEDELKSSTSAAADELTVLQLRVMRIPYLKVFRTPKIGNTGIATVMVQLSAKIIARHMINLI
jgi:hypothetical protein